jgi:hypothetical protein
MGSRSRLKIKQPANKSLYIIHSPLLILSIVSFLWITNIVISKDPSEIANFVIPQLYLPLLIPFLIFMTSLFGYLTLNISQGGIIAFFTSILLLFKLQQIEFEVWWVVPYLLMFSLFIFLSKKKKTNSLLSAPDVL